MEPPSTPNYGQTDPEPEYSNPPVAEGINTSERRPLRRFFIDLGIITAAFVLLLLLLDLFAGILAPLVPFSWEKNLIPERLLVSSLDDEGRARQEELRRLAARLSVAMELPDGMTVTVHYDPGRTQNAFATLGGQIVIYRGILDLVESEDELAMLLAHEIGHVKNRDAIKGAMRALGILFLMAGIQDSTGYLEGMTQAGMASYSRGQEEAADAEAVCALGKLYGNAGGAKRFFAGLAGKVEGRNPDGDAAPTLPSIMASHPDTLKRMEFARETARRNDIPEDGEPVPLAEVFR